MKYLRRFLLLLALPLLVTLGACQRPEDAPRPANLMPKDKMVSLLVSLHLLETRIDASQLSPDTARALYQTQQREIFRRAQTSDSTFQRSYRYYGIHGKDLDEIYQAVLDSLGGLERKLGKPAGNQAPPPGHPTL